MSEVAGAAVMWPFPWWTVLVAALTVMAGAALAGLVRVRLHAASMARIAEQLRVAGMVPTTDALTVIGDTNALVVSGERLAVADLRDERVVQTLRLQDVVTLKTYEGGSKDVRFRLVTRNGAQTRLITTRSIVQFAQLFASVARRGVQIEYIVE